MDRRLTPANPRVAAMALHGVIEAPAYVNGDPRVIARPVVNLLSAPHGRRERQLLFGEKVLCFEKREGWAFVQAVKDGYVGYVTSEDLEDRRRPPSHRVNTWCSHVYSEPSFKSYERMTLSLGALLRANGTEEGFLVIDEGYVPLQHVVPADQLETDLVTAAQAYLGVPYLWGGNSIWGIDCSGLVQAACTACGLDCPGDSDLQEADLGRAVPQGRPYRKGDLLFWKGHVGIVAGRGQLLHANAHSMTVAFEPLEAAIDRILQAGDGPVTAHKRLKRRAS